MNCQTLKKCVPKGCSVFFAISALFITVVGIWLISIIPKKLTTECNNIKLHTQVEVDSVPEKVYFSDEGRYLYIFSGEKAWRYDILLGEKEIVDSDNIPDPPPIFTLPDGTTVQSRSGKIYQWPKISTFDENAKPGYKFSPTGKVVFTILSLEIRGWNRPHGPAAKIMVENVTKMYNGNTGFGPWIGGLRTAEYLISDAVFSNDNRVFATIHRKETAKEKIVAIWIIEDGSKIGAKVYPWTGG